MSDETNPEAIAVDEVSVLGIARIEIDDYRSIDSGITTPKWVCVQFLKGRHLQAFRLAYREECDAFCSRIRFVNVNLEAVLSCEEVIYPSVLWPLTRLLAWPFGRFWSRGHRDLAKVGWFRFYNRAADFNRRLAAVQRADSSLRQSSATNYADLVANFQEERRLLMVELEDVCSRFEALESERELRAALGGAVPALRRSDAAIASPHLAFDEQVAPQTAAALLEPQPPEEK